jgi:hypothetical protein
VPEGLESGSGRELSDRVVHGTRRGEEETMSKLVEIYLGFVITAWLVMFVLAIIEIALGIQ